MQDMPNKIITYTSRNNNNLLYEMVNSIWIAIKEKVQIFHMHKLTHFLHQSKN